MKTRRTNTGFRKYWFPLTVFVVVIAGALVYRLTTHTPKPPIKETREKPQGDDTAQGGHFHNDGTFQAEPHEAPAQYTVPPGTVTTPDFPAPEPNDSPVETAYKRLDYISKNRQQWGHFSPRALELMEQLTPVPKWVEGEGETEIELLEELCALRDPRSAELLVSYQLDSSLTGRPPNEALVAMGPAAIPALVERLEVDTSQKVFLADVLDLVPQIVSKHRLELGGIVEHIIIPKIEAIATLEGDEGYTNSNRVRARKALARLQKIVIENR